MHRIAASVVLIGKISETTANSRCCTYFCKLHGGMIVEEKNNNRAILAAVAAAMLLCSLPLTWMTIQNAQIEFSGTPFGSGGPFGNGGPTLQMPGFPGMQLAVTGTNGSMTLGAKLPIWLLVVAAVGAILVAMLNELNVASVPAAVLLVVLGVVGLFFGAGLLAVFSGEASLGIGYLLAVAGLVIGTTLVITQIGQATQTPVEGPGIEG